MCFNYKVSLFTFVLGTIGSVLLILYGNPNYKPENIVAGIFLLFISSIQFMEFLLWIDIHNKLGINHIVTLITPILNVGQPTILYIIKLLYLMRSSASTDVNTRWNGFFTNQHLPVAVVNILYVIYLVKMYYNFISKSNLTTTVEHGHIKWPWLKYSNPSFYLILFAINIFYMFDFKYSLILFTVTYIFLCLSVKYFSYNIGELWCFFGSAIPMIIFTLTKFI